MHLDYYVAPEGHEQNSLGKIKFSLTQVFSAPVVPRLKVNGQGINEEYGLATCTRLSMDRMT